MESSRSDKLSNELQRTTAACEELNNSLTRKNTNNLFSQLTANTVTEWLDGTIVQTTGENIGHKLSQEASTGFAWSLYDHTLKLFSFLLPMTSLWSSSSNAIYRDRSLKRSLGKLFLWGDSFRNGKLEIVLDESNTLRECVIENLASIAKILLFKITPSCLENVTPTQYQKIWGKVHDLEILVEKAQILTDNEYESDGSSILSDAEERSSLKTANPIKVYVDCLMALLPSIEETLSTLEQDEFENSQNPTHNFQVSGPAQPYVLKVYDKFPKANLRLMHRLGEANWQRHVSLRKTVDEIEAEKIPKTVFVAVSLFQDSGLGTSLQAQSAYAATMASHSSFISTTADQNNYGLRVPPTPTQVFDGVPFNCQICGHTLSRIKNRIDWRRHVFADLNPYICTFSSCKDELKKFPTRKLWEEHEFGSHRLDRYWSCSTCQYRAGSPEHWRTHLEITHSLHLSNGEYQIAAALAEVCAPMSVDLEKCPLCLEVPGKSQRNFVSHVGRHMESIALAALPREDDTLDSDVDSVVSGVSSTISKRGPTAMSSQDEQSSRREEIKGTVLEEEDDEYGQTEIQAHTNSQSRDEDHTESDNSRYLLNGKSKEHSQDKWPWPNIFPRPASSMANHGSQSSKNAVCEPCLTKARRGHKDARDAKYCPKHQCPIAGSGGIVCYRRKRGLDERCEGHTLCEFKNCTRLRFSDETDILQPFCFEHTCVVKGCAQGKIYNLSGTTHRYFHSLERLIQQVEAYRNEAQAYRKRVEEQVGNEDDETKAIHKNHERVMAIAKEIVEEADETSSQLSSASLQEQISTFMERMMQQVEFYRNEVLTYKKQVEEQGGNDAGQNKTRHDIRSWP